MWDELRASQASRRSKLQQRSPGMCYLQIPSGRGSGVCLFIPAKSLSLVTVNPRQGYIIQAVALNTIFITVADFLFKNFTNMMVQVFFLRFPKSGVRSQPRPIHLF